MSSSKNKLIHQTQPIYLIEKIIRTRIYQSLYWKESCFGLSAESILDKAVQLSSIGGQYANQKPTNFLCLLLKLLQIQPDFEIALFYVQQTEFKYLRALGAFYIRLTAKETDIFNYLEPLLYDRRKLRMRTATGYTITFMDEFVDSLLIHDRYCDIIIPRIKERYILEDLGQLEPRVSTLEEELEEDELLGTLEKGKRPEGGLIADKAEEAVEKKTFVTGQAADPAQEAENRGWNKKKIKNLYKR
ncbi:MAG: hypothetical protein SGCHY_001493 [Lobulomycetales sp.]